jgi:hypothetical protein
LKKILLAAMIAVMIVVLFSLIFFKEISLLHFIDISFYFSAALILVSLLTMVVQKGFFDGIFYSFRSVFNRSGDKEEVTPLSDLISFRYNLLLSVGLVLLIIMIGSLFFYYL